LQPQYFAEALNVGLKEPSISRSIAFRCDEALALKKTNLGDGDLWKLLLQEP
jgi:hypothetical protein